MKINMNHGQDNTIKHSRKFKQITDVQRHTIQTLVDKGFKVKDLMTVFDFHKSTLYRELKRGKVKHLRSDLSEFDTYSADRAIDQAKINKSNKGPKLKLV